MPTEDPRDPADPRDIIILADERDSLKIQLKEAREAVREKDVEARKVPGLRAEIERLQLERDKSNERSKRSAREAGDLEERIRVLEAELLQKQGVEAERDEAEATAEDAREEAEQSRLKYEEARADISTLKDELGEAEKEVDRLRAHEEQTKMLVDALDRAKDLT